MYKCIVKVYQCLRIIKNNLFLLNVYISLYSGHSYNMSLLRMMSPRLSLHLHFLQLPLNLPLPSSPSRRVVWRLAFSVWRGWCLRFSLLLRSIYIEPVRIFASHFSLLFASTSRSRPFAIYAKHVPDVVPVNECACERDRHTGLYVR